MVNIESKPKEQIELRERMNKLEEITRKTIKLNWNDSLYKMFTEDNLYISTSLPLLFFSFLAKTKIFISSKENLISVRNPKYYDSALKLAEAYEKELKDKWTLQKDYFEN